MERLYVPFEFQVQLRASSSTIKKSIEFSSMPLLLWCAYRFCVFLVFLLYEDKHVLCTRGGDSDNVTSMLMDPSSATFARTLAFDPLRCTVCLPSLFSLAVVHRCIVRGVDSVVSMFLLLGWMVLPSVGSLWMVTHPVFFLSFFLSFCLEWMWTWMDWNGWSGWAMGKEGKVFPSWCPGVQAQPTRTHDGKVSEPPHQRETFECERFQQSKA